MISAILKWVGGVAIVFGLGVLAGADWSNSHYQRQLEAAKVAFERLVSEASAAYASQKSEDDAELARLKALADTTPANPTIALKKDAAGRVGAIR